MIAIAMTLGLALAGPQKLDQANAIWITRFDYTTRADVVAAVEQCAEAGFDTLVWQVRGNATAFYRSSFEPWAEQLGWKDPGFDPLAVALEQAHARGLALHAWINVMPAWWGTEPPASREHLYYRRPEWFWFDQHGRRQALCKDFYVSLNPCLPEVRRYLARVIGEVAGRYAVDGIHLDYLRFPNEAPAVPAGSGLDYPLDPGTIGLFRRETGSIPDDAPERWDTWRSEQVTRLLAEIGFVVRRTRPGLPLSVAVGPDLERALHHFQDVASWVDAGLVDALFPMNYSADDGVFRGRFETWRAIDARVPVVMGVMLSGDDPGLRAGQLDAARASFGATCAFAYSSLFDSPNETIDRQDAVTRAARARRRAAILPVSD